jgi:hypothetical protein
VQIQTDINITLLDTVPDLGQMRPCASAGFTIVLMYALAQGPTKNIFYEGFLFMWCIFKFEGVLFWGDSRHNDRV